MWKRIKRILHSVGEYKKYAIITPFVMVIEVTAECFIPTLMTFLVNGIEEITKAENPSIVPLIPYIIGLLLLALTSMTAGILGGKYASIASSGFAKNLRQEIYDKIQSFSFENIDHFHGSSLITRITTDVNNTQMAFQMCIRIVIRAPMMMIVSAILAFIKGGAIAWIFVAAIPIIGLGLFFIIKNAMKIFKVVFKRYDKLNESVQENVSGIRVVKSFVREKFEQNKFNKASDSMMGDFIRAEKLVALNNPLMNTSIHLVYILVMFIASYTIFTTAKYIGGTIEWGSLTVADMSALLTYGLQILMNLQMVSIIMVMLIISLEAIVRISEVLEEAPTIVNPDNPIMALDDGSVDFTNVNFKYKATAEKNTLENINLHIKSGQFIGVLGATGSGKTSLINLISRLYDITSGELLVGGHNVKDYDLKTLRDSVAVVLQKNYLFSGTLKSNMQWGNLTATDEEITRAINIAQIPESISSSPDGLNRKVEQGGNNFSGGQKQRLCIARAILKNPTILILDDSTSAVDTKTDRLIRKGLRDDIPDTTKIVIAQRISSIEDADQIVILNNGKIDAIGKHDELLKTNKIYQDVYYTQNQKGDN